MPKIVMRMSDEQRARLESYRAANGLRSLNAAMLHLIDTRGGTVKPYMDGMMIVPLSKPGAEGSRTTVNVSLGPAPSKPGSRLKAEKGKK